VTVLARLTSAFERLAGAAVTPACPACGASMTLRREDTVGELPFVVEQLYACERCGRHVTRVQPWAIPD
jgi:C4-type Zn-finger protein